MPNKNYVKGRRKEYNICNEMKDKGCRISQRTAGSHSPIDVIAIDEINRIIYLIQSKPSSFSKKKEDKLYKENKNLQGLFEVRFEVR
ncbi:MAG: hypothetical protein ACOC5T_01990 [Elusimicrobiota bacterium]